MGSSRIRTRVATATATLALAGGALVAGAPAASADERPIPPISCGVMNPERGPVSEPVHALEPALLPVGLGPLNLAFMVHGLNCAVVLQAEYLLGLQQRWTPGPS